MVAGPVFTLASFEMQADKSPETRQHASVQRVVSGWWVLRSPRTHVSRSFLPPRKATFRSVPFGETLYTAYKVDTTKG